jgi:hypothetical protein
MSNVVDFLEKLGSEAQWRHASSSDIEAALADAGIDAPMCAAILAKSAEEVQALLGQVKLMTTQTPTPSPHKEPDEQPGPDEGEEEEENDDASGRSKPSSSANGSLSTSSHSSQ